MGKRNTRKDPRIAQFRSEYAKAQSEIKRFVPKKQAYLSFVEDEPQIPPKISHKSKRRR